MFGEDSVDIWIKKHQDDYVQEIRKICVSATQVLLGHREWHLEVEVFHPGARAIDYSGMVEKVKSKYLNFGARVLVHPDKTNSVPIQILNVSSTFVTLYKGQIIDQFYPLSYQLPIQEIYHQMGQVMYWTPVVTRYQNNITILKVWTGNRSKRHIQNFTDLFAQDLGRAQVTHHYINNQYRVHRANETAPSI